MNLSQTIHTGELLGYFISLKTDVTKLAGSINFTILYSGQKLGIVIYLTWRNM